jgi:hypothetical protein
VADATVVVLLDATTQLGNHGGEITLLAAAGLKVHGVANTADQGERERCTCLGACEEVVRRTVRAANV